MHGGTVEVHSDGVNRGSEFMVRLPTLLTRGEKLTIGQKTTTGPKSRQRAAGAFWWLTISRNPPRPSRVCCAKMAMRFRSLKMASKLLKSRRQFRPDVVVLDIAMPKLNGYEVARKIREQSWGEDMVLIALTGWGQKQDRERTQEAGFDAHLTKAGQLRRDHGDIGKTYRD